MYIAAWVFIIAGAIILARIWLHSIRPRKAKPTVTWQNGGFQPRADRIPDGYMRVTDGKGGTELVKRTHNRRRSAKQ